MKLGYIMPFNHLEYSHQGGIVFALVKEAMENMEYKVFLQTKVKSGIDVYLDANIHERERQQINFDEAMKVVLTEKICTVIIIPDCMFLMKQTLDEVRKFLRKWYIKCKQANIEIMAVCQGRNMEELVKSFKYLNNHKKIDRVGIPFDNTFISIDNNTYINQALSRIYLLQKISRFHPQKKIHCLGCNSVLEVKMASLFPFVYSLDTKLFTRIAMADIVLDKNNWVYVTKPRQKMGFNIKLNNEQLTTFENNVNFMKKILQ